MGFKSSNNIQLWLNRNRFCLWWMIYIPLVSGILFFNFKYLDLPVDQLSNFILSPQYKMFNSPLVIILGRIVIVALGAAILMICVFFPYFNISKEGVQWTKEFQEDFTKVSGEIAGEEIEGLIQEESFRLSLIYEWLKLEHQVNIDVSFLLRELLTTLWEAFPKQKISLRLINNEGTWSLLHPLLPMLIVGENLGSIEQKNAFGVKIRLGNGTHLRLEVYPIMDGFSPIDEQFMLILGEIFVKILTGQNSTVEEFLSYFEKVPLTFLNPEV